MIGFLAAIVIVAMLYEPPAHPWALLTTAIFIPITCVATARNRLGVLLGIAAIFASRIIIAAAIAVLRYLVPHH